MLVQTALVLILLQLGSGSVQGCPEQQCQALVEEVAELKESILLLVRQHETASRKYSKTEQKTNKKFEAIQETLDSIQMQMAEADKHTQTFRNESDQKVTQIKEELVDMKQKTETSFAAVQDTLGDLEAEQQKVGDGLETLRSETVQLALSQIKEELSGDFAAVKENLENVKMRQLEMKECIQELKHGTVEGSITVSYPYIATACSEILTTNINSPPGYYQLRAPNGTITTEYCPMECTKCLAIKSTGGWRRVAYLNMTDPTHQCPSGFSLFTQPRRCSPGANNYFRGCASVTYPVHGIQYQRVCGRVIAYHKGDTEGFNGGHQPIDNHYVDGVSVTHGNPLSRRHIWTFVAAHDEEYADRQRCPCSNTSRIYTGHIPDYVGADYFCDSGISTFTWSSPWDFNYDEVYTEDPLWDGSGCGPTSSCCTFNSPPWFCKELSQPTTDDIELRVCRSNDSEDTQISLIEMYTQ